MTTWLAVTARHGRGLFGALGAFLFQPLASLLGARRETAEQIFEKLKTYCLRTSDSGH